MERSVQTSFQKWDCWHESFTLFCKSKCDHRSDIQENRDRVNYRNGKDITTVWPWTTSLPLSFWDLTLFFKSKFDLIRERNILTGRHGTVFHDRSPSQAIVQIVDQLFRQIRSKVPQFPKHLKFVWIFALIFEEFYRTDEYKAQSWDSRLNDWHWARVGKSGMFVNWGDCGNFLIWLFEFDLEPWCIESTLNFSSLYFLNN